MEFFLSSIATHKQSLDIKFSSNGTNPESKTPRGSNGKPDENYKVTVMSRKKKEKKRWRKEKACSEKEGRLNITVQRSLFGVELLGLCRPSRRSLSDASKGKFCSILYHQSLHDVNIKIITLPYWVRSIIVIVHEKSVFFCFFFSKYLKIG